MKYKNLIYSFLFFPLFLFADGQEEELFFPSQTDLFSLEEEIESQNIVELETEKLNLETQIASEPKFSIEEDEKEIDFIIENLSKAAPSGAIWKEESSETEVEEEIAPVLEIKKINPEKEKLVELEMPIIQKEIEESKPLFTQVETKEISVAPSAVEISSEKPPLNHDGQIQINLKQVFLGAPIIYSVLAILSIISFGLWSYSMLTIRSSEFLPDHLIKEMRTKLMSNQFAEVLNLCNRENHFLCKILASGITSRKHGVSLMFEAMKNEGKRATVAFWQKINFLNDIAIIAPMLGLLGTVIGMFYAFYDLNRSIESVSVLFDGLGISVGTTVAGLIVAIFAMTLHSIAKYRLIRLLAKVENEAKEFASLIDAYPLGT
ncbi:MAG: MotA/TolQ/ExbB proton channel family protein [Chlamydiae bacterium]|nr:MotA/TolQ/ExbB proton channel family protein [Chlamydiota bacterium]